MDTTYTFRWDLRCCFCLFDFHDGDKVVTSFPSEVANSVAPTDVLFEYKTPVFDPQDQQCIPPRKWRRYREVVPASHQSCLRDFPEVHMNRLWAVVRYDFQPPVFDIARRRSVLATEIITQTESSFQKQARLGLLALLSSSSVPKNVLQGEGLASFTVSVCNSIWGTGLVFEGVRYMSYLSNKKHDESFKRIERQKDALDSIYFASNHLGIVFIYFEEPVRSKQELPGIWWSCVQGNLRNNLIEGYTDGYKMRDLRLVGSNYPKGGLTSRWLVLPSKPRSTWIFLDCDKPGITGFSACMVDGDLVDLHCHTKGKNLGFYHDGGGDRRHAVWLYFPVEQGERIFEVWRRQKKPQFCRDIPMLCTNKGRVFVLGTHVNQYDLDVKYDRLTSFPTPQQARFWFSCHEGYVDYLAFDSKDQRHNKNEFHRPLQGISALCSSGVPTQTFASSAPLKDVVEVVPCRSWVPGSTGIVGLLLTYSDRHRETLGQIQLDHLLAPMKTDPKGDMWLGLRYLTRGSVVEAMRLIPISVGYWRCKEGGNGRGRHRLMSVYPSLPFPAIALWARA
ncbi:hypothetical protein EDB82DRAFT_425055 [Fusarium venenatum]|uniref:uncharacterized protein n=1 Tax=Fusarium venenatum TaxID=56646 RepID=UPI001D3B001D|nr:hypothetical protein EDB82DRAFT_425055 [Fusarium venenatum]